MNTISRIKVYQVDLPLHEGGYRWSGGKSVTVFDSTIVEVETTDGLSGFGEVCPLGPVYLPAYAAGVRCGIQELGPQLIGMSATRLLPLNCRMDKVLKGHPYVKSAIDMACWDLLGKQSQSISLSVNYSGGRFGDRPVELYRAISQAPAQAIWLHNVSEPVSRPGLSQVSAESWWRFIGRYCDRIKCGFQRATSQVIVWWRMPIRDGPCTMPFGLTRAVENIDVYIEQPCSTYDQCQKCQSSIHPPGRT